MFKHSKGKIIAFLMVLIFSFVLISCTSPAKRGKPQENQIKEEPTISLYINETGETKKVKMEEYIKGVVAAEMDPTWEAEALRAQAILARTFTLKKIEQGGVKARGTDASTDVKEFQAYDEKRINDQVQKAVESTKGEVITHNDRYIMAWFFADGGGVTSASAIEGLSFDKEKTPYIHSVEDPGHAITSPENKAWTATFSSQEVGKAFKEITGQEMKSLKNAAIKEKGPSGRAMKLSLNGQEVSAPAIRLALGNDKMRSTLLTSCSVVNGKLVLKGKGYGHGVGMSQWGAKALAEQGKKGEDIVKYFFKDVKIKKIY